MSERKTDKDLLVSLYRIEIKVLKILPMLIGSLYFSNTVLSYFGIDYEIISYVAGLGLLPLCFLYLTSHCFRFCEYHRIPLYYIVANDVVCWYDANYTIPTTDLGYLCIHTMIFFLAIILIIYLRFNVCNRSCKNY